MSASNKVGKTARPDTRRQDRAPTDLKAIVQVKESDKNTWKEVTEVKSVSRNGAGFTLERPCVVGRLVTIVMPLETELRAYDHDKELYPVMGIVQYCNAATVDGKTKYHVGVGFIGKHVPESFKQDPTQSYRIGGMSKEGLWKVTEAHREFKTRKDQRYWMSVGVTISLIRKARRSAVKEKTLTRNVSASGISIASKLDAKVGDKIKIASPELDFYAVAIVRNINTRRGESSILHVELLENEFPIDKLIAARTVETALTPATAPQMA
jgi:hypothetical protein